MHNTQHELGCSLLWYVAADVIIFIIIITIIIILLITFMQGIYSYIPETYHISRVYSAAAVLYL